MPLISVDKKEIVLDVPVRVPVAHYDDFIERLQQEKIYSYHKEDGSHNGIIKIGVEVKKSYEGVLMEFINNFNANNQ